MMEFSELNPNEQNPIRQVADLTLPPTSKGPADYVRSAAWSPDGKWLASGSVDGTAHLWDSETNRLLPLLENHAGQAHEGPVSSVIWSPNGKWLASSSYDRTIRLWDPTTGALLRTLKGHADSVCSVAWSPDGKWLASGSCDKTIQLWDPTTGKPQLSLTGHEEGVRSVSWSPDNKQLVSGANDKTVRVWDAETGKLRHILEGHTNYIRLVAWEPDGKRVASGSHDGTIKLWDPTKAVLLDTLKGHQGQVCSVAWFPKGPLLASLSYDERASSFNAEVHFWRTDTWVSLAVRKGLAGFMHCAWHPVLPLLATTGQQQGHITIWQLDWEELLRGTAQEPVHYINAKQEPVYYTNAKVVLVGDSGVGKSGLSLVLTGQPFAFTDSTHGRRVWTFDSQEVSLDEQRRGTRETLLWDLAGQPGYRLIHQLHLNEVVVALVVFDARSETAPFAGVEYWTRALAQAQRVQGSSALPLRKLLVAARVDRGGVGASQQRIQSFVKELGFDGFFETSAKEGWQIAELREAIGRAIDWRELPTVSSTELFRRIKTFLVGQKEAGRFLSRVDDLYTVFLSSKEAPEPEKIENLRQQFEACIGRVESVGLIKRLSFGNLVLLHPEFLDAYASALVNAVKDEPDGLGSISEERVRTCDFRMSQDERLKDKEQEKLLLIAMVEDMLRRELVLREDGFLIFPSQSTLENPDLPDAEGKTVVYSFEGSVLNIYTTLAVRLANSGLFKRRELWRNAITYTGSAGGVCGIFLCTAGEGRGELTLFFDKAASEETRFHFEEYTSTHLQRRALPETISRRRIFVCPGCGKPLDDLHVTERLKRGKKRMICGICDTQVSLLDREERLASAYISQVWQMDRVADRQRERAAAFSTIQGKIATGDFDVFLCYNQKDKAEVKKIAEKLKGRGILPWLDEWEQRPGFRWQRLLEQQIKRIKSAAVFVGKEGVGPWQHEELDALLRQFQKRNCPVIPVILATATKEPKLPIFLAGRTWVDFRKQDPNPFKQLIWGITGKYDRT